jgi:hypothetical protein
MSGDRVVVDSGFVVVTDFRQGTKRRVLPHDDFVLPDVRRPKPPSAWQLLREALARAVHGPDEMRQGGAVRSTARIFWPDAAFFAPAEPIVFRWRGACPTSGTLLIVRGEADSTRVPLGSELASDGGVTWPAGLDRTPGRVLWRLLDEDGACVGGGRLVILTGAAADSARTYYRRQAEQTLGPTDPDLGAALLAAADRHYLW